jgi:hypothetical protein
MRKTIVVFRNFVHQQQSALKDFLYKFDCGDVDVFLVTSDEKNGQSLLIEPLGDILYVFHRQTEADATIELSNNRNTWKSVDNYSSGYDAGHVYVSFAREPSQDSAQLVARKIKLLSSPEGLARLQKAAIAVLLRKLDPRAFKWGTFTEDCDGKKLEEYEALYITALRELEEIQNA